MNFEVGQQNATFCHCSHCDQLCGGSLARSKPYRRKSLFSSWVPLYVCHLVAVCVWIPYGGVHLLLDRAEKHYDAEIAKAFSNMGFPYDRIP
ncbi:hypothetical protein PC119_g13496 [Phytophthora cactorum]|uniref:Uncharacterized protein n=1 Tax=Phytophthora cactorum TaxID=29920 RepID=A0A8T0YYQ8_9STRA|nr:hypothetical protein PC113_g12990 [Phytophthora cactorum]KAG3010519.1 hypothetical protein PC119_g13496 [Phytophthora cactorum]KAG3158844.1 hypothetical protein C6341_g14292 [Phytophthora cactorum]